MWLMSIASETREKILPERKEMLKTAIKITRYEKESITTQDKSLPLVLQATSVMEEFEKFLKYIFNDNRANREITKQRTQFKSTPEPKRAEFTPTSTAKEGVIEKIIIAAEVSRYPM